MAMFNSRLTKFLKIWQSALGSYNESATAHHCLYSQLHFDSPPSQSGAMAASSQELSGEAVSNLLRILIPQSSVISFLAVLSSLPSLLSLYSLVSASSPVILQVDRVILFGETMDAKLVNVAKQLFWQRVNSKCLFVSVLLRRKSCM